MYRVSIELYMQTRVEVWENKKCCGNTSRRRVFPQLFRVLPNLHECLYNSVETRSTCFLFLLETTAPRKRKTTFIIVHQTQYEKSDCSRAFNQFTIACELDIINATSATDIAFIMSSSTFAWLLSPLECSPQKQNGCTLRFCF